MMVPVVELLHFVNLFWELNLLLYWWQ